MDISEQEQQIPLRNGQWEKIKSLPEEVIFQIESFFEDNHFSLDVRDYLSDWIEAQPWGLIQDENNAQTFLCGIVSEIKRCAANQQWWSTKRSLKKAAMKIEENYGNDALKFAVFIEEILKWENSFLEQYGEKAETSPILQTVQEVDWTMVLERFETMSKEIQGQINEAKSLTSDSMDLTPGNMDLNALNAESSNERMNEILEGALNLLRTMHPDLEETTKTILDYDLQNWICKQRLYGNPSESENLDKIQKWCSKVAVLVSDSKEQIKEISRLQGSELLELDASFTWLSNELLTRTFLVLEQPPQIMKMKNLMAASICLLSGESLNIGQNPLTVTAELISIPGDKKYELEKSTSIMKFVQNRYIATFEKMILPSFKRCTKSEKYVTEEIFAVRFSMEIPGEGEKPLQVLSLPVVVISNGNQYTRAEGTILWHNFLGQRIRPGENEIPAEIPWPKFEEMIDYKFKKDIGVPLKREHFEYFAAKIFGETLLDDLSAITITWDEFWRNKRNNMFTFWDWFYAIIKLIQTYFPDLYKDNLVMGFVKRTESKRLLLPKANGTFLLRFSDNQLGGISIATRGPEMVMDLIPYTSEQLKVQNLAKWIRSLKKTLLYLYPDRPAKEAFEKYRATKPRGDEFMENLGYERAPDSNDSDDEQSISTNTSPRSNASLEQMDTEQFCAVNNLIR